MADFAPITSSLFPLQSLHFGQRFFVQIFLLDVLPFPGIWISRAFVVVGDGAAAALWCALFRLWATGWPPCAHEIGILDSVRGVLKGVSRAHCGVMKKLWIGVEINAAFLAGEILVKWTIVAISVSAVIVLGSPKLRSISRGRSPVKNRNSEGKLEKSSTIMLPCIKGWA